MKHCFHDDLFLRTHSCLPCIPSCTMTTAIPLGHIHGSAWAVAVTAVHVSCLISFDLPTNGELSNLLLYMAFLSWRQSPQEVVAKERHKACGRRDDIEPYQDLLPFSTASKCTLIRRSHSLAFWFSLVQYLLVPDNRFEHYRAHQYHQILSLQYEGLNDDVRRAGCQSTSTRFLEQLVERCQCDGDCHKDDAVLSLQR